MAEEEMQRERQIFASDIEMDSQRTQSPDARFRVLCWGFSLVLLLHNKWRLVHSLVTEDITRHRERETGLHGSTQCPKAVLLLINRLLL